MSYLLSYQSLALLLISTAHDLREINQGTSHVVTFGLLMGVLVLGLERSKIRQKEFNFIAKNPIQSFSSAFVSSTLTTIFF